MTKNKDCKAHTVWAHIVWASSKMARMS